MMESLPDELVVNIINKLDDLGDLLHISITSKRLFVIAKDKYVLQAVKSASVVRNCKWIYADPARTNICGFEENFGYRFGDTLLPIQKIWTYYSTLYIETSRVRHQYNRCDTSNTRLNIVSQDNITDELSRYTFSNLGEILDYPILTNSIVLPSRESFDFSWTGTVQMENGLEHGLETAHNYSCHWKQGKKHGIELSLFYCGSKAIQWCDDTCIQITEMIDNFTLLELKQYNYAGKYHGYCLGVPNTRQNNNNIISEMAIYEDGIMIKEYDCRRSEYILTNSVEKDVGDLVIKFPNGYAVINCSPQAMD